MPDRAWTATRVRYDSHAWDVTRTSDPNHPDGAPDASSQRRSQVYGVLDRDGRAWVAIDGEVVVVAHEVAGARRATRHRTGDELSSPMPATVVAVHVAEGDQVNKGDVLVLLEAMKMEVPLRAPHGGRVISVRCTPGALVQPGIALVTIEESS